MSGILETPSPGSGDPAWTLLQEDYASGKLVVFAGSAFSASAGLPSWERLAHILADHPRLRQDARQHQELLGYIAKGLLVCGEATQEGGERNRRCQTERHVSNGSSEGL